MTDLQIAAAAAAVATVLGAAGSLVVFLWRTGHRHGRQTRRDALAHLEEVADRQERQIERLDGHVGALQKAYDRCVEQHGRGQMDLARLYGYVTLLHRHACDLAADLRECGRQVSDPPPLPEPPEWPGQASEEFEQRTLQQRTATLQQITGQIPPPPPAPTS